MAKKQESITSQWRGLITKGAHAAAQDSGEVFRVQPVDLETFVLSNDYLRQSMWGMSEAQIDFLKHASDLDNNINFFVLFIGKGGGKNWASGVLFLYVVYQLLCMYDPHGYLDHNEAKAITLINVAINAKQAQKNFFNPLVGILKMAGSKAFRDFGFDPENDIKSDSITFPRNIEILSANSKAGGIEGYDILVALADEVDDVEFHGVDRIVETLRSSSLSRFQGKEKIMVISYRRYIGSSGKILEYYNSAVGRPHIYARRYASWEFHPKFTTQDNFQVHFDENPERAACIYGSIDSGSFTDSWIKDVKRIKSAMNIERDWIFDWPLPYQVESPGTERWWAQETHGEWKQSPLSEHSYTDDNGQLHVLDPYDIPIKRFGDSSIQYVMIGDPAQGSEANGGDGYGLVLAHRELFKDEMGRKFVRPVIDFAFRFTGRMFEEGQVQMIAVQYLFEKLKERCGYNIKVFSSDGWNSLSLTQWIAKTYKDVIVYDRNLVEYKDYSVLRDAIFGEAPPSNGKGDKEVNGGIDIPWHPIVFEELRNLREIKEGKPKVDHPDNGTKDIADTIAKACRLLIYEWPLMDVYTAGTNRTDYDLEKRIRNNVATEEDIVVHKESYNSNLLGIGSWRNLKSENRVTLDSVLPTQDW